MNDNWISPYYQLSYTYDWNVKNLNHVGLSEFVIKPEVNIIVGAIYTSSDYLQKTHVKD